MKPSTRFALLLSLVTALAFVVSGPARADHIGGHDHPFCAQGGGDGTSSGGAGGMIADEAALAHFADAAGGEDPGNRTVLIPTHLAERFGQDDPIAQAAGDQFIELQADQIDDAGVGASGSAFHGGHGGGPGGGQGGSTFLGGGDGGCNPNILETVGRPRGPGQRLPITGSLSEQMGLLGGLMLSLGSLLWLVGRRRGAELALSSETTIPNVTPVTATRRGYEVVSRLKAQMKGSWTSSRR